MCAGNNPDVLGNELASWGPNHSVNRMARFYHRAAVPACSAGVRTTHSLPMPPPRTRFLPIDRSDMRARGWTDLDVLIVSGDAYVDHPAFGPVLIARWLESLGLRVGFVAQPRWDTTDDLLRMGRPRLFVGVSAGNLDSMLNKLTAQKKVRSTDDYSPGGRRDARPNRATIVYANLCRQAFPDLPIVLGGIEASLRRLAHYDYWSDSLRRSILLDAKAHLLVYGMGERAIMQVATHLRNGADQAQLRDIRGTAHVRTRPADWAPLLETRSVRATDRGVVVLPSFEDLLASPTQLAALTRLVELESNPWNARPLLQRHGDQAVIVQPPAPPRSTEEMDSLYRLPFAYEPHPVYKEPIPAFETIRRSIVTHRGCFGGCAFCSITQHEGRTVQGRSHRSIVAEVERVAARERGVISDLGGPTANMYAMGCGDPRLLRSCRRPSCVHPKLCPHLVTDHGPLLELMRAARRTRQVRHVFVASGVRYDLALRSKEYVTELAAHHTGGQLSVAPEHVDERVLRRMRKPGIGAFEAFVRAFETASHKAGREQYLVPYLLVGHPGSTMADTIELAMYLKRRGWRPRQVQEFIPTPMTVATAMYYAGVDPMTGEPVAVVKDLREKRMMKALVMWWDEAQWPLAREALRRAARHDLIGRGENCLIPPGSAAERRARDGIRRHR